MGILLFSCNALFSIKNQYFSRRVFWWNGAQHIFSYFFFQKKRSKKSFSELLLKPTSCYSFFEFFLKMEWHFFLSFFNFFPTRKKQQITLCVVRLCVNLRASFFSCSTVWWWVFIFQRPNKVCETQKSWCRGFLM